MKITLPHLLALVLVLLIVWSAASAPTPLPEEGRLGGSAEIPIREVLTTIAAENDAVRSLYTKKIVGEGKKVGLKFDEDWEKENVQAGPLPALFLSKAAASLQKQQIGIELILGSH
ncbi:MAG: hypothetical protein ACPG7R_08170, partial [Planctomycetota bacterium]